MSSNMPVEFFIIGGTEKAGTTSLYEYFVSHPRIKPSKRKETNYFRGNELSLDGYRSCFPKHKDCNKILMEASPAYLGLADEVSCKIGSLLDCVHLVFVVRNPIQRLRSSYLFHRSKLYISDDLEINEYVKLCLDYQQKKLTLENTPFKNPWFLEVLEAGAYKRHLEIYQNRFSDKMTIIDFNELGKNPLSVVQQLCDLLSIDDTYFDNYEFFKANKTFQTKYKIVHKLGMNVNNKLEPFFRRRPMLKRKVVSVYQRFNGRRSIKGAELSSDSILKLREFYQADFDYLDSYFQNRGHNISWKYFNE